MRFEILHAIAENVSVISERNDNTLGESFERIGVCFCGPASGHYDPEQRVSPLPVCNPSHYTSFIDARLSLSYLLLQERLSLVIGPLLFNKVLQINDFLMTMCKNHAVPSPRRRHHRRWALLGNNLVTRMVVVVVAVVLATVLSSSSSSSICYAMAPPHPSFADWEPAHRMRQRLNMTQYQYRPIHLPGKNEHCRYLTEDECRREDEAVGRAKQQSSFGFHKNNNNDTKSDRHRRRRLNPSVGSNMRVLVLLVRFSDHGSRWLPPREHFEEMLNGNGTSTLNTVGSFKEYLRYASLGRYRLQFDVRDWHTDPNPESYYSQGQYGLIGSTNAREISHSALDSAQAMGIDWNDGYLTEWWVLNFQNLHCEVPKYNQPWTMRQLTQALFFTCCFHFFYNKRGSLNHLLILTSGYGAEYGRIPCAPTEKPENRIWSQGIATSDGGWLSADFYQVNGYAISSALGQPKCTNNAIEESPAQMGIMVHEYIHGFSVLDLYDADENDPAIAVGGIGSFDIMSNTYGWNRDMSIPGHLSPFSRLSIEGWLEPILITQDGTYAIQPSEISSQVYKLTHNFPEGEFLLIENRQSVKWDKDWPSNGIVIYHIDEKAQHQAARSYPGKPGWPAEHYMVSVVQADGLYDIEKGVNLGDAGDFWKKGETLGPGPDFPNTDSIQGGIQTATGLIITVKSNPGFIMSFKVTGIAETRSNLDGEKTLIRAGTYSQTEHNTTGHVLAWILSLIGGIAALLGVLVIVL